MDKEKEIEEMANIIREEMDKRNPILDESVARESRLEIRERLISECKEDELKWLVDAGYGNVEKALREYADRLIAKGKENFQDGCYFEDVAEWDIETELQHLLEEYKSA